MQSLRIHPPFTNDASQSNLIFIKSAKKFVISVS